VQSFDISAQTTELTSKSVPILCF